MNYKTYEVKIHKNGDKCWYFNGKLHREDGPAVEYTNNDKEWWFNNKLHRKSGPAIERGDGSKEWYFYGKLHRVDGPAVEYANGNKIWYLDGFPLIEQEFISRTKPTVDCSGRIVEIDGKKYILEPMK